MWEKTVIDIDQYLKEMGWVTTKDEMVYAWLKQLRNRQAEISYKAGLSEGKWRGYELALEKLDIEHGKGFEVGLKSGIRKVVEWVEEYDISLKKGLITIPKEGLEQNFKKENGL